MYRRKICLEALVKVAGAGRLLLRGRCGLAEAVLAFFVEHPTKELEKTVAQAVEAIRAQASRRVCDDAGIKATKRPLLTSPTNFGESLGTTTRVHWWCKLSCQHLTTNGLRRLRPIEKAACQLA